MIIETFKRIINIYHHKLGDQIGSKKQKDYWIVFIYNYQLRPYITSLYNKKISRKIMTYFTYILHCADDTLYTGITTDIVRRTKEHNTDDKKGAKYTKNRRPVSLVYTESFPDRSQASIREYEIKRLSKKNKIKLIYS